MNAIISYLRNFQFLILNFFFKFLILIFNTIILIPIFLGYFKILINDMKIFTFAISIFISSTRATISFILPTQISITSNKTENQPRQTLHIYQNLIKNILYILTEKHFWIKKMHTFKMLVEKKITCIKCPRPLLYSPHKKHVDTLHLRSESNHTSPMAACWAGSSISH